MRGSDTSVSNVVDSGASPIRLLVVAWVTLLGVTLSGCHASSGGEGATRASAQLPVQGGREQGRMEAAIEGLSFRAGVVEVAEPPRRERPAAIRLLRAAEGALSVENARVKAAGLFRDAILADPGYAPAYEGLARALIVEGDPELVAAALHTAVKLDPDFDLARWELGIAAQMRGDYAAAVSEWASLVERNPDYPEVYARMAIASYFDNDLVAAQIYLLEADKRKQSVPPQFRTLLSQAVPHP